MWSIYNGYIYLTYSCQPVFFHGHSVSTGFAFGAWPSIAACSYILSCIFNEIPTFDNDF